MAWSPVYEVHCLSLHKRGDLGKATLAATTAALAMATASTAALAAASAPEKSSRFVHWTYTQILLLAVSPANDGKSLRRSSSSRYCFYCMILQHQWKAVMAASASVAPSNGAGGLAAEAAALPLLL